MDGGVVAVPTDTIYGIACLVQNDSAVERVYAIKGRDPLKPIAICVSDVLDVYRYKNVLSIEHAIVWMNEHLKGSCFIIVKCRLTMPVGELYRIGTVYIYIYTIQGLYMCKIHSQDLGFVWSYLWIFYYGNVHSVLLVRAVFHTSFVNRGYKFVCLYSINKSQ